MLLATGCRERPRTARLVPGDRPAGVMTTGELQQRVYLGGERLAGRALVVGAEHVSFSAAMTLAHAGADVIALVTEYERQQSYAAFRFGAAVRWRVPVWTWSAVRRIAGRRTAGGRRGGGRADRGGAVRAVRGRGLHRGLDTRPRAGPAGRAGHGPGTRGPAVDTTLSTSLAGVFAAGNLVHAAETADIAALSGRHAARHIAALLGGAAAAGRGAAAGTRARQGARAGPGSAGAARLPILVEPPLRWISPNAIGASAAPPPLGRFVLRSADFRRGARLEVRQDGRLLARSRPARLIPGRPVHLGAGWLPRVDPAGGPVRVVTGA